MRRSNDPTATAESERLAGEGFLGRWSRRKRAARDTPAAEPPPQAPVPASAEPPGEAPALTDADMPPVDSLGEDSDYSGFLSPGVSEELRRLALRKLFSAAKFNVRDGLNDYDDDFTRFEPLGDIVTSDMRHQLEMEAKRRAEADAEARPEREAEGEAEGAVRAEADEAAAGDADAPAAERESEPTGAEALARQPDGGPGAPLPAAAAESGPRRG